MISRRLLRVKILQILYAKHNTQNKSLDQYEKELFFSINKTYDLYHYFLQLLIELAKHAEYRIEAAKEKLRPTYEDLHPNKRFIENSIIQQLKKNLHFCKYISENKISWNNYPELIKNLHQKIKNQDYYNQFIISPGNSYKKDKELVLSILEKEFSSSESLYNTLEEINIFWNDDVDFVLSMVIKTIKGFNEKDKKEKLLMPLFKNEDDKEYVKKLFRKTILNQDEYNKLIKKHTQNWEFERIAIMDILIMQMALAEVIEFPSIPVKVSLNEYIEIAKDYSTVHSNTFINGILDNIIQTLKKENKIIKTGRGLIEN
jgi:N utilization substance protein B